MSRAITFDHLGSTDALTVSDVPEPQAGPGEVRVRVKVAGLNPVDWKILVYPQLGAAYGLGAFPSGNGNDFAGVVDQIGEGVEGWRIGDEVLGGSRFFAQADYLVADPAKLVAKPAGLSWEQAGGLDIAGRTAWASVAAQHHGKGDTVLVSAAAGGVGVLAAQLAKRAGATVIGSAGTDNHEFLRSLGIVPVEYGDGLVERIRGLAPDGVTAVLDNHGRATIEAGIALGVDPSRINSIADRAAVQEVGGTGIGGAEASIADLAVLAQLIADGEIEFPIDSSFPLERVREAYAKLQEGHARGKIVLVTE
ncbi:NADP-dependent oxidoreductase [Luethyella okanaganae]|uniref:NADP-dependent oxidoreductase n=1 Tax=Luethyella okanaganae TaxID=69372 RepID=A0ABW1VKL5_9MICO